MVVEVDIFARVVMAVDIVIVIVVTGVPLVGKDVVDTIVVPVVSAGPELGIEDRVGKGVDDKVVK